MFMDGSACCLIDDRVTNIAHASAYRIMDEGFYTLLEELFQENICQGGISPKHLANCTFILDPHLIIGIDLKSHYTIQVSSV